MLYRTCVVLAIRWFDICVCVSKCVSNVPVEISYKGPLSCTTKQETRAHSHTFTGPRFFLLLRHALFSSSLHINQTYYIKATHSLLLAHIYPWQYIPSLSLQPTAHLLLLPFPSAPSSCKSPAGPCYMDQLTGGGVVLLWYSGFSLEITCICLSVYFSLHINPVLLISSPFTQYHDD